MPDISEELAIIANERQGSLVKQAIYDALQKINQEADRRPVAKLGVPIDEAIIDTGWVTNWLIGEMIDGIIVKFDGSVISGSDSGEHYTARINNYFVNGSGRAFVLAVVGETNGEIDCTIENTDIEETAKPEWELVDSVRLSSDGYTMMTLYNQVPENAPIYGAELGFTLAYRGILNSSSELPSSATAGDLYLCQELDEQQQDLLNFYYYDGEEWVNGYETYHDDAYIWLAGYKKLRLVVWTALVEANTHLDVKVTTDTIGASLSAAIITCYDSSDYSYEVSSAPYRILADQPSFSSSVPVVETVDDLPLIPVDNTMYYVYQENRIYSYDSGEDSWHKYDNLITNSVTIDTEHPNYIYIPANEMLSDKYNGLSRETAKIFVCVGTWGTEDKHNFVKQSEEATDETVEYYSSKYVSPCTISIAVQYGGENYLPSPFMFTTEGSSGFDVDNDVYKIIHQEGFYVVPIEIGPRERRRD